MYLGMEITLIMDWGHQLRNALKKVADRAAALCRSVAAK